MGRTPAGQTREKVFRFVRDRLAGGDPPTVREVMDAFGFRSPQTAREHLDALIEEGRLDREPGLSRGLRLPARRGDRPTVLVPLLGRVPAGPLDAAIEDLEGHLPVQTRMPVGELFGLRVKGDSMKDAGILDGDLVVVRRQPRAEEGQIVVALVGDEATVKHLRFRRGRVELHPANDAYRPIVPEPEAVRVIGRVVEVRRRLD
ncbi:MAG TPA: transcriptional repressor LexA [Candidatus Sulfotelmatobacter sp.]|jgi:repressor LexA|nr:transcriptional repressor LexA [Candidatus Sulfotelmatobacter sp.]